MKAKGPMSELLVVKDLHKSYSDLEVLKGISFKLEKGETTAIIGPSGTGKSTLLRCINLISPPDSGTIWFDGLKISDPKVNISKVRQKIGMVFQHFDLFMHLSALSNVSIGLRKVKGLSKREATERAMEELTRVGLADKRHSYPAELSGGQQQRVGIARALAMDPILILFDEPTSALDPELIGEVLEVMTQLAKEGMTMIVVTHEIGFARSSCSEIIFIEDGRIVEKGTPQQLFATPKHERTRQFLSKIIELYGKEEHNNHG